MFLRSWEPVHPLDGETTRLLEDFVGTRGKKHAGITLHVARFSFLESIGSQSIQQYETVKLNQRSRYISFNGKEGFNCYHSGQRRTTARKGGG